MIFSLVQRVHSTRFSTVFEVEQNLKQLTVGNPQITVFPSVYPPGYGFPPSWSTLGEKAEKRVLPRGEAQSREEKKMFPPHVTISPRSGIFRCIYFRGVPPVDSFPTRIFLVIVAVPEPKCQLKQRNMPVHRALSYVDFYHWRSASICCS